MPRPLHYLELPADNSIFGCDYCSGRKMPMQEQLTPARQRKASCSGSEARRGRGIYEQPIQLCFGYIKRHLQYSLLLPVRERALPGDTYDAHGHRPTVTM